MFVLKTTYDAMVRRAYAAEFWKADAIVKYGDLSKRWSDLVDRINALGGEEFIKRGEAAKDDRFTAEDIQRLLMLCHPDKHDGKQMATDMTQKLLKLKEAM